MDKSPEEILKRLEELRCWQGVQQEKLLSKQLSRSQLCSMEQNKLYEMFGLSLTSTVSNLSLSDLMEQQPRTETECVVDVAATTLVNTSDLEDHGGMDVSNVGTPQQHFRVETPINNFSLEELESYGKENRNQLDSEIEDKPKKAFLKRGDGLAARFKIHPEKLRIENLPKYKFANAHKNSKFFRNNQKRSESKRSDVPKSKQVASDLKLGSKNSVKDEMTTGTIQQLKSKDDGQSRASKISYGKFRSFC